MNIWKIFFSVNSHFCDTNNMIKKYITKQLKIKYNYNIYIPMFENVLKCIIFMVSILLLISIDTKVFLNYFNCIKMTFAFKLKLVLHIIRNSRTKRVAAFLSATVQAQKNYLFLLEIKHLNKNYLF